MINYKATTNKKKRFLVFLELTLLCAFALIFSGCFSSSSNESGFQIGTDVLNGKYVMVVLSPEYEGKAEEDKKIEKSKQILNGYCYFDFKENKTFIYRGDLMSPQSVGVYRYNKATGEIVIKFTKSATFRGVNGKGKLSNGIMDISYAGFHERYVKY